MHDDEDYDEMYDNLLENVTDLLYVFERYLVGMDPKYYTKEMIIDHIRRFNLEYGIVSNVILTEKKGNINE